jgi:enoyl-CoA hydratase/carnithine racemase
MTQAAAADAESNAVVLVEHVDQDGIPIAIVTLNRADIHNPVDEETIAALEKSLTDIVDSGDFRALVVTGAGPTFSSGGDLKGYQTLFKDRERFERFVGAFGRVCKLLERSPILTLAMVNGTCLAGGMELALSCDLVVVAESARIGDGHMRFSQMPGSGCQRLVRAIGVQRARHWLFSGDLHTAEEAVASGLAIASTPDDQLRSFTLGEAARLCRASSVAMAELKHLVVTALTTPLDEGLEIEERTAVAYATGSADAVEGIMAFAERRPPAFSSRLSSSKD